MTRHNKLTGGPRSLEWILFSRFIFKLLLVASLYVLAITESVWKAAWYDFFKLESIEGSLAAEIGQVAGWAILPIVILMLEYYYFRKRYKLAFIIILIMIQKTKVLTLILFGLLFINLSAQEDSFENDPVVNSNTEERKLRFGLQLNPHISWLSPNTKGYDNEGSKFGMTYGLSAEYFLTKNYLFSSGIFISALGGKVSYEGIFEDNNGVNVPSAVEQSYNIKYIAAEGMPAATELQKEVDRLLEEVNDQMSTYRKDSELSRFNQYKYSDAFEVSPQTGNRKKRLL